LPRQTVDFAVEMNPNPANHKRPLKWRKLT
jgi:hypothetical protein